jgi:CubicO group peptidase (beta-lactamase class C family)
VVQAVILGMIAQAVTGEPIQQLITQGILRPLDLTHTSFPTVAAPRTCQCRVTPWKERMRSRPRFSSHRPNRRGPARPEP